MLLFFFSRADQLILRGIVVTTMNLSKDTLGWIMSYIPYTDITTYMSVKLTCKRWNQFTIHRFDGGYKGEAGEELSEDEIKIICSEERFIRYARANGFPMMALRWQLMCMIPTTFRFIHPSKLEWAPTHNLMMLARAWPEVLFVLMTIEHVTEAAPDVGVVLLSLQPDVKQLDKDYLEHAFHFRNTAAADALFSNTAPSDELWSRFVEACDAPTQARCCGTLAQYALYRAAGIGNMLVIDWLRRAFEFPEASLTITRMLLERGGYPPVFCDAQELIVTCVMCNHAVANNS